MITPWVFEFFHALHDPAEREDAALVQQQFRRHLDLWADDEARGFEGIFFSEHHFGPAYSPSPNLLIAALAGRTRTLRLGVLGTVAAHATPWRVVEEFAMLDHLTGGRLEMGVVSGIPPELVQVGIGREEAAARHAEALDVLQDALRHRVVSHDGECFRFDQLRLTPIFCQQSPAIWTAAISPASAARAAGRGLKMCSGFASAKGLVPVYDAYREAARAAGQPDGPDQLALRRQIAVVESGDRVGEARQIVRHGFEVLAQASREAEKVLDSGAARIDEEELISGTPEQVADQIIRQCRTVGAGHFLAGFNIYEPELMRHTRDLFGYEVIPLLRKADIS